MFKGFVNTELHVSTRSGSCQVTVSHTQVAAVFTHMLSISTKHRQRDSVRDSPTTHRDAATQNGAFLPLSTAHAPQQSHNKHRNGSVEARTLVWDTMATTPPKCETNHIPRQATWYRVEVGRTREDRQHKVTSLSSTPWHNLAPMAVCHLRHQTNSWPCPERQYLHWSII
jgi:hypothetical protein